MEKGSANFEHRYLITGVSGFVAGHFLRLLDRRDEPCVVLGLDVQLSSVSVKSFQFPMELRVLDLLDQEAVSACLLEFRPTRILHLASVSNVGVSWQFPVESFKNNTNIFLNILEGLRKSDLQTRVLSVGSSEEYGIVRHSDLPLVETMSLNPGSPYGVARVAQEQLSKVFADGYGMDIVMTRSFNHVGRGQKEQFVVPSFVRQIVGAKLDGVQDFEIQTGNTKVIRDFLDVRDVVEAYFLLFERGKGEVYNVCSGVGRSLDQILASVANIAGLRVRAEWDSKLLRPNELMEIIGSPDKIQAGVGWVPHYQFDETLRDLVAYWVLRLKEGT